MSITPPFLSRTPPPLADFDDDENEIQIKKKSQSPIPSDDFVPNSDENQQSLECDENLDSPADLPANVDIIVESTEFEKIEQNYCPVEFNSVEIEDQPVAQPPAEPERRTAEPEQQTAEPADHTDAPDEDDFGAFEDFTQFVGDSQEPANSEWAANFEQPTVPAGAQEQQDSIEESNWAADFDQPAEVGDQQPTIPDWPAGFPDDDVPAEDSESFSLVCTHHVFI